jgi:hypothetical protein
MWVKQMAQHSPQKDGENIKSLKQIAMESDTKLYMGISKFNDFPFIEIMQCLQYRK